MSDKRQIREESARIAHDLIRHDDIERAAQVLAGYREKFGASDDLFLKNGLALLFVLDLLRGCRRRQTRRVSYLIREHYLTESASYLEILKRYELMMFLRLGDTEGAIMCMRRFLADANRR